MTTTLPTQRALSLIYPLTDALQFSLFLVEDGGKPLQIKGHGKMQVVLSPDLSLPFNAVVKASAINEKEAYVVVEVLGNLSLLLSFDAVMKELTLCVLDSSKLPAQFSGSLSALSYLTVKTVFEVCAPMVRGIWMREERGATWSRLDAVDPVGDRGTEGADPQACRPVHSPSGD